LLATLAGCSAQHANPGAATGGVSGGDATGGETTEVTGGTSSGGDSPTGGTASSKGGTTSSMGGTSGKGGAAATGGTVGKGGAAATGGTTSNTGGSTIIAGTGPVGPTACGIDNAAFCEDFEKPSPGGRGGDLDEKVWSMSRFAMSDKRVFSRNPGSSNIPANAENVPTFCGSTFMGILPPTDVKLCTGISAGANSTQLSELLADGDGFALNSMMVRQPFDFTGRTGTVVFEVDMKRNKSFEGHGWWTEMWITKDPVPIPYHGAPTVGSYASDAIGFQFAPVGEPCFNNPNCNQVGRVFLERDYDITRDTGIEAVEIKVEDGKTNRVKLMISKDAAEFWVTDSDKPTTFRKVASVTNLNLRFTVGYLHLQHSQYNAQKAFHASTAQTYRWDNVGFDGPVLATPRAYDAADMGKASDGSWDIGYPVPITGQGSARSISFPGVDLTGATKGLLNLNIHADKSSTLRYRFNGKAWHTFTTPSTFNDGVVLRAFSLEAPVAELVAGANTVEFDQPSSNNPPIEFVGNLAIQVEP
jgi:hypothetical protein